MAKAATGRRERPHRGRQPAAETVDPIWLLKGFAAMVLIALACGYATLCGLFYRGQWQLVLHPARTSAVPSSEGGLPIELVRFGAASTGVAQLTGWWIPADAGSAYAHLTLLYLPGGQGSLAGDAKALRALHSAGLTIFAIDYRGYGQSADLRPNQKSMTEDADTAWDYLTSSRALWGETIIPYGEGLGATLALGLASSHGLIPAVVLDSPDFDVERRVRSDPRSRLLPTSLLFHDRFSLFPALAEVKTPKLILSRSASQGAEILHAADPKMTVSLPPSSPPEQYTQALDRFLDQYARAAAMQGTRVPMRTP